MLRKVSHEALSLYNTVINNRFVAEFDTTLIDITICGSMSHKQKWLEIAEELRATGFTVATPDIGEADDLGDMTRDQIAAQRGRLLRQHLAKISASKAILVCNDTKNGVDNYIGGSTFLEMSAAFVMDKPIYVYGDIPALPYTDEILSLNPIVLRGDLGKIEL